VRERGTEMNKILDGVRYNTEAAIEIGSASQSYKGDCRYWKATLYVTPRSKRFFIAGTGGPMSRFAQSAGVNQWSGGSDLIPMSKEDALEWAEDFLTIGEIEKHFSDIAVSL